MFGFAFISKKKILLLTFVANFSKPNLSHFCALIKEKNSGLQVHEHSLEIAVVH